MVNRYDSNKDSGFTLIELLLALALVAALVAAGLAAYQIQLRNFKVDKTALQMQQWLQAGMAVYADCGKWPTLNTLNQIIGQKAWDTTTCKNHAGETRAYMPPGSQYGPWPSTLVSSKNFYNFGPVDGDADKAAQFFVETYIEPDTLQMKNIGKMIAGRLPVANADEIINKRVRVIAYINKSSLVSGGGPNPPGGGSQIVDMEMVNSGQTAKHIKKPDQATCDALGTGLVPALVGSLSGQNAGMVDNTDRIGVWKAALDNTTMDPKTGLIEYMPTDPTRKTTNVQPVLKIDPDQVRKGWAPANTGNQVLLISACMPLCTVDPTNEKCKKTLSSQSSLSSSSSGLRY